MPATSSYSTTGNAYINGVLGGVKWAVTSLTFSFPTDGSFYGANYAYGEPTNAFEAFTLTQQTAVLNILQMYSSVINVTFTEVTETASVHGDLRFAESDATSTAWAYYPSPSPLGGDAWFNNTKNWYDNPVKGNYAYLTMIHEIGHALGLKHPHESMGLFGVMPADRDSLEYTVMSYKSDVGSGTGGYTNGSSSYPQTLMMYDIVALQTMYGANYSTNSGNSVYSWSSTTGEMSINGIAQGALAGNKIFMTLWDGGGNDTYDFSNYTTNLTINLNPGEWTTTSAAQLANLTGSTVAVGNIANALLYNGNVASLIENAIGGSGSDTLVGNAANNSLTGNAGNDSLNGAAGTDTAVYSGLYANYQLVHNANGTWTITDLRGGSPDGVDTLTDIEWVQFSDTSILLDSINDPPANPVPTIVSFSNDSGTLGDNVTNDNTLSFSGTAGANATVKVYDAAVLVGTVTADANGVWAFTTAVLTDGAHAFTATATDGDGNCSAASTQLTITIDTVAPTTPTIDGYTPDSAVAGDGLTNANTLTLFGTAQANSLVHVYDGATLLGTATANASGQWSFETYDPLGGGQIAFSCGCAACGAGNTSNTWIGDNEPQSGDGITGVLNDGAHVFTVVAADAAGNLSATSAALNVTIDATAPAAPAIASWSADSGVAGDGITSDNTLALTGTAQANSTVRVYDGATLLGTVTADGSGAWSYTTAALADGAHSLTVTATDAAGNVSAASAALNVTVDTAAPAAPVIASFSTDSGVAGDGITNDNTLTLTGTAQANSTVQIYDGATLLGTTTANGSGAWSYTTAALADGAHSFTATAADAAGNVGVASTALSVTVDTAAPAAPAIASWSTDSGVAGDGITSDNTLMLTGTAAANSTVRVYDGATLLGTATADGSGAWTYTTAALADGSHSFTATAVDAAGNAGAASAALNVTVDTAAPAAPAIASWSADSGVAGDGITNDNTLAFTGTAQANSTVRIYDGATLLGTVTANGSGAWSFTTATLADGAHSFTATAADAAGNVGVASAALNVTVDTAAPSAPAIASFSADSGVAGDGITNDNTLTLTGTAQANSTVRVYDGATLLGTATADGSGAWTYTTAALADGSHNFTATAADAAGNVGVASAALSVTIDTGAPATPAITSWSNDSGTAGDGVTSDNALAFIGTAQANSTVRVYDGATLLGTVTADGSGAWSFTTATLADGSHSFTATATDTAGNTSAASSALSVTVDSGAPAAPTIASWSTDSGVAGDGITGDNTLAFTGTAQANSTVRVYDGATLLGTVTADGSGAWSFTTATLADGAHSFTATATDTAGNTGAASSALSVTIDTAAPAAPAIASFSTDSGVAGDGITNDNTLTLTGTAQANSTVRVYDGATLLGTATADGSGAWTYTTAALADGSHDFTATAVDTAGNAGAASATLNVTVDTAAPAAPAIASWSADSGVAGDGITNDNTLAFTGTAQANSTVRVYDGATLLGTATADGSGAWTYTTAALADGAHSFTATAADAAGNVGVASAALNVTIDTAAPAAPAIASWSNDTGTAGDGVTSDNTLTFTGTAQANSTVQVYDGATLLGTVTANGSGAWSFTTAALADGSHNFTATAADAAGNVGVASAALNVTIGTGAPSAPAITSWSNDSGTAGDGVTSDNTLAFTGTAQANSTVRVYDGATLLGTATADGSGAWSFTTATLADGAHSFTATATDAAGNTGAASSALSVTVDSGAPAAPAIVSWSTDSGVAGDGITSDSTLAFTGTAQANSAVRVYDGATLLGTVTADGSGAWSFTTATLADGAHSFTATATDTAGNTGAASSALSVTIDTGAPAAPAIASWSNDTGTAGDGITSDNTLAFTGTAQANSAVRVYDGATLLGTVTADGSGAWSFTTATLADGSHSFTATATDTAGNTGAASSALSVTIDTGAPAAPAIVSWSTDSGVAGDGITSDSTLAFTGTAQANSAVRVYDGATLLGTVTADGSGAWTYTTAALADGPHSFTATAADAAGNVGAASAALSVTVDTAAPAAPVIVSFSNDSGVVGDGITNDSTLTFAGTAQANSTVRVYDGATLLGTVAANGSGAWSFTTATLTDGAHSFTATAADAAGNVGVASAALNVTVDTAAPGAPAIASFSTDSGVAGDGITNDNTLTFTGTAQANSTVRVYDGATLLGTATANGSGAWTFTTAALADGSHGFTATATDAAGNLSAASSALSVTIDTGAPAAPAITSWSNDSGTAGDGITNDNTLAFTGTAAANSTVRVYDGATLLGTVTANGSGAWSFTTAALADGAHSLTVTATDAAGNVSAASAALSVTVDTAAPSAVIASFSTDSGAAGDGITNDNTLTLTGSAQANSTVRVYDGATLLGTATANGSGAWSFTTATLVDGSHSFTATATDPAGNLSAASSALSVTIDTGAPAAPAITSWSNDTDVAGDGITSDNTLAFTGTAAANSTVRVYDGATLLGTATANGSGAWSFTTATLADGAHSFTATATDTAGNVSAASVAHGVTIDTTPADLVIESISAPLSVVQGAALNFSYVVKNTGGTQAGLNWSGIAIDQQVSETNYQGFDTINSLAAGAAITFNNSISTAGLSVGQHTLYIEGDYWYNAVTESSEGNNVRAITFNVTAPAASQADLVVESISAPLSVVQGAALNFSYVVKNTGGTQAGLNWSGIAIDQQVSETNYQGFDTINSLAAGAAITFNNSISTAGLSVGQHTLYIEGDYWYNAVTESSEGNNVRAITFNVTAPAASQADLVVESISAPLSVVQGAALNFSYVVKNTGGTQAGLNWSGIAIDQQVSETNYQGFDTINSLAAGAAITFNNSISTAGLSVGQHTLYIEGDYWYNGVTESNEGNNVRAITFNVTAPAASQADLVVESISAPLSVVQGAALNFSYVVKNTGGTQAGLNWSGIAIDQQVSETNYQGFDTINSLAAGAAITFNNSISTAGLSVGQHTLYIEGDYWYNAVTESSEGNNVRAITFNVTAPAASQADLVVESISAPLSVVQGAALNFSYVVKNTGGTQAGLNWSGIAIDQQVSETNYQGFDTINSLAAGAAITFNNSISTAGLSVGQHTLYIEGDYWYNGVTESNEGNNVRAITFNVTAASAAAPAHASGLAGEGITSDNTLTLTAAAQASSTVQDQYSWSQEAFNYDANWNLLSRFEPGQGGQGNAVDGLDGFGELPVWIGAIDDVEPGTFGNLLNNALLTSGSSVGAEYNSPHGNGQDHKPSDLPAWIGRIDENHPGVFGHSLIAQPVGNSYDWLVL